MRIAYIINQYPKASHSFIRREIRALESLGVEVVRIALRGWDAEIVDTEDQAERDRTRYVLHNGASALLLSTICMLFRRPARLIRALSVAFRMSRGAERPLSVHLIYLAEACRIEPWLRTAKIDHLHAHFGTNSAEVAMLVHALGGPAWSFTVHGPEEFDKAPLIGLAEKIRDCSFVVAISSYGRSQLYRLVDTRYWPKVRVVHCGLDSSFFSTSQGGNPEVRRLICVGRLCEQKGQLLLIEATRQLLSQGVDFELVLAGDGELRPEIEQAIRQYDIGRNVRITGWISNDQVREELLAARALVLPSFAEGLPVAIMEAMALRRPVISTYIAGIPELVQPGTNGWLVPAGDVNALIEAMHACLEAPLHEIARMGISARERILTRHDAATEAKKIRTLLSHNKSRS